MQKERIIKYWIVLPLLLIIFIVTLLGMLVYNGTTKLVLFGGTSPKIVLGMNQGVQFFLAFSLILFIIAAMVLFHQKIWFSIIVIFFLVLVYLNGRYVIFEPCCPGITIQYYLFPIKIHKVDHGHTENMMDPYNAKNNSYGYKDYFILRRYRTGEDRYIYLLSMPGSFTEIRPLF